MTRGRKIEALRRRRDFLNGRIAANPDADLTYDKAEASALTWALDELDRPPESPEDDPLTGRCARCGKWYDEHPGGFCPDQVDGAGQVEVGKAEEFVPADDPDAERYVYTREAYERDRAARERRR